MNNSPSQMIPDMLEWRQIWGSGRPRKGSDSVKQSCDRHPSCLRPSIVLLKRYPGSRCMNGNTCGCRMSWTKRWAAMVPRFNTRGIRVLCPGSIPLRSSFLVLGRHDSKQMHRWVGVKGSTRDRCHDPTCPSTRHLRMVREDRRTHSKGATCASMAADETVGCSK
ncbi:hypothetical protein TNCV_3103351 [Trichonephila clavipes]|nr:hypothetical protein TNCV_3103351 [Trichonephila clavipes]